MVISWEWTGKAILAFLSCGAFLFSLNWLKNWWEQIVKIRSDNAKHLLYAAEQIHNVANAMLNVVNDRDQIKYRKQASPLWTTHSRDVFLTDWEKYCRILDSKWKRKTLCVNFENAVGQLINKAKDWYAADKKWRASVGIIEGEYLIGRNTQTTPEKQNVTTQYRASFNDFIILYQKLNRHIIPLIKN
jgi:hypothetical protein